MKFGSPKTDIKITTQSSDVMGILLRFIDIEMISSIIKIIQFHTTKTL